jgi:ABC-type dipeptide/oligopeptide/nickel transport system permease component
LNDLVGLAFVLGTIIVMGLGLTVAQTTNSLRDVRLAIMALLANFVVVPVAAYILIQVFSLDESLAKGCSWYRWRRVRRACPKWPNLPRLTRPRPPA